jgi:hypothetical protein
MTVTILTGFPDLSTGFLLPKQTKPERPGDPAIVDRITRAMGAYQFRTGKRMQWNDLADQSGLTQSTASDIATLKRRVQIADAAVFGRVLGVRPAWIAFGEEPMVASSAPVSQERPTEKGNNVQYAPPGAGFPVSGSPAKKKRRGA